MKKNALFFSLLAFICLLQTGCTAVGFAIGAATDARQPKKEKTVEGQEIVKIKKNALVTVYRKDREPVIGKYRGTIEIKLSKDSPMMVTGILLEKKGGHFERYQIPLEQIERVYVPARTAKGKIIGLVGGFGIDLGIVLIGLASLSLGF